MKFCNYNYPYKFDCMKCNSGITSSNLGLDVSKCSKKSIDMNVTIQYESMKI